MRGNITDFAMITMLSISYLLCQSQSMQGHTWIMGTKSNDPFEYYGGTTIDFTDNWPAMDRLTLESDVSGQSMYCSNEGDLELFSNGCRIYDANGLMISNGDSISYTPLWSNCPEYDAITTQGIIFLEWPMSENRVALFHIRIYDDFSGSEILYSVIEKQTGEWVVVEKNVLAIELPDLSEYITAVRHANGRDWWILATQAYSATLVTLRFSQNGIDEVLSQDLGEPLVDGFAAGQSAFSYDGTKYVRFFPRNGLFIYDFDRCTGLLSNLLYDDRFVTTGGGVVMSQDSRFLYIPTRDTLYQYDLVSQDVLSSREIVGIYDGFEDPLPTTFYQGALAPNGKIYITSTNGTKSLHVLHQPWNKGHESNFRQHEFNLTVYHLFTVPNYPNYRLGPIDDGACDTLGIDNIPIAEFYYEHDSANNTSVLFTNTSGFQSTNFTWFFGEGSTTHEINPKHNYSDYGVFDVCLVASNNYGQDTFCRSVVIEPILEFEDQENQSIDVSPVPAGDYLKLKFFESGPEELSVIVFNSIGQPMVSQKLEFRSDEAIIDLSQCIPGLYILCLFQNDDIVGHKRIVKIQ